MYPCRPLAVGAFALAAAIPATPAFADEIDSGIDAIVVTATRQAMRTNELLSDVTVIDRGSIEASGQETISDLLARQPGIQMSSSGGPGTTTSFYIRGARPEQTKVLVDGVQLNSVDLSGSPLRFLSLADVERIEILRGPASALYGADAIGGVIQIFTRTGAPGLKADAFAGYGTDNTWQANAGLSGGNEQWRFRIEGNHAASDGFSAQKHASNRMPTRMATGIPAAVSRSRFCRPRATNLASNFDRMPVRRITTAAIRRPMAISTIASTSRRSNGRCSRATG